jgi:tripartite-type tricarboxylate transporter receptor subunit TctC
MRRLNIVALLFAVVAMGATPAPAADFPTKPIEMQVCYPPGGTVDAMARVLANHMEKAMGQPVVVLNKPGAGGAVGAAAVKGAKPDGYTIGVVNGYTFTYTPLIQQTGYSFKDFTYLASVGTFQFAIVASSDKPYRNFKELIAYAKKNPGMTYAFMNPIAENLLTAVGKREGLDWRGIPTKGAAEVMTAIVGKHVDFGFSAGAHIPFVKAGEMIVLASLGKIRLLTSPEVPTLQEYGYDFFLSDSNIVFAPKGVSDEVLKKLTAAIERAAKDPSYVELLQEKLFIPVVVQTGDDLMNSVQEDARAVENLLKASK